jgi:hypothetical protein
VASALIILFLEMLIIFSIFIFLEEKIKSEGE